VASSAAPTGPSTTVATTTPPLTGGACYITGKAVTLGRARSPREKM
jgi:hypothetical protein